MAAGMMIASTMRTMIPGDNVMRGTATGPVLRLLLLSGGTAAKAAFFLEVFAEAAGASEAEEGWKTSGSARERRSSCGCAGGSGRATGAAGAGGAEGAAGIVSVTP